MTLLEQCQIWNEQNQPQKIINAIEALPAEVRTPELDSELARAYNNVADVGDRELFEKAVALLKPHEAYFQGDHNWNYRLAYAYYYLDQEGLALRYFQKALEARPGDADTQEMIEDCRSRLALPRFAKSFRRRTQEAWAAFAQEEAELRRLLDQKNQTAAGEELVAMCGRILRVAFGDAAFELGFNGEKYELILTPEGDKARLFELVYFQHQAPAAVRERWNIWVGRQPSDGFGLKTFDQEISAQDVQVWVERQGDNAVSLTLYCEKLLPLLREDEDKAWWMLSTLTDQVLGEIAAMALLQGVSVVDTPCVQPFVSLARLPETLAEMGLSICADAEAYLENSYFSYEQEPHKDPEADWRMDVYIGSTRCPTLINEYMEGKSDTVDVYHRDGVVAGFFCYPLDGFAGEERAKAILDFRDTLEAAVAKRVGKEAITFLGGATGVYCGYLDFIAWDLQPVLEAAVEFFAESPLPWANFHTFRRDVATVRLLNREDGQPDEEEPEVDAQTGSLLSQENLVKLESFDNGSSGYFYQMLDYLMTFLKTGLEEGRFTEKQARRDLQLALWYAYACLNIDEYEFYYRAAQWLPDSEQQAVGCGVWYYRYSVALMYCGKLKEAWHYAERGGLEEPDYPWIWLQVGKLRSHFGDREGALDAVRRGLALEPGDHEFLTLQKEAEEGASLEQMEYHWIHPEFDRKLQEGLDADADAKQRAISCITVYEKGLAAFMDLFHPAPADYTRDDPYCSFHYPVQGHLVELVFQMNEAGLSKLKPDWLKLQKERLDEGRWLTHAASDGETGTLDTVLFGLDYQVGLLYKLSGEDRYFRVRLADDGTPAEDQEEMGKAGGKIAPEIYTEEEMDAVQRHIETYYGTLETVWHELISPDIHVDICVIPPTQEKDYYTLITMGMGAHRMDVPTELKDKKLARAELALALPSDWKVGEGDEKWYWPVRLLKVLARLPGLCDTWLGWGHTVDNQEPFAENTDLCAAFLIAPQRVEDGGEVCALPGGEEVNFYQVIPLYRSEMEYKVDHGADALLDKLADTSFVIDPHRPDVLAGEGGYGEAVMDDGSWHLASIREKNLPVEEITAFNHMAIYLRWCIEHDLMGPEFLEQEAELVRQVEADPARTDLRIFIRDVLDGRLTHTLFHDQGEAFSRYYYGDGFAPYFPSDIDDYALRYFGSKRYHSNAFRQEAYLFIPFDEAYYQAMAQMIQQRWDCWLHQEVSEDQNPSVLARAMMRYLNCQCQYFPPMADDDPIAAAYGYAKRLGVREGFVPVLVRVDEVLWERLMANSDPDSNGRKRYAFDPKQVARYRKSVLGAPVKDGKAILTGLLRRQREKAGKNERDWEEEILGAMAGGQESDGFLSYWDSSTGRTCPLILAQIPVKNPWEIFAYLPFGGWNECPGTENLMAVAKYWYLQYGAVPAAMSYDELEFTLPAPVPPDRAMELAQEQYGFCPDMVDQGPKDATVGKLADTLRQSELWYFWWD